MSRTAALAAVADPDPMTTPTESTNPITPGAVPGGAAVANRRGSSSPNAGPRNPTTVPKVTIGNGRPNVVAPARPDELPQQVVPSAALILPPVAMMAPVVAPVVAPPPVPLRPAALAPAAPLATELLRPAPSGIPVASAWGTLRPGWPAGALFGLAGLILAPIAGAWLGYRRARAVKAASELVGS